MKAPRTLTALAVSAFLLCIGSTSAAYADDVVILINKRNPTKSLDRGRVSGMFLGNTAFWHGVVPVKLVVRSEQTDAGKAFYEPVLGMSGARFSAYWTSRQLAGQGVTPPKMDGVANLIESIKKTPGGIGFALRSELEGQDLSGVKVVSLP